MSLHPTPVVNYVNLLSGVEYLNEVEDPRFIRLHNSHLENKAWNKFLLTLDYDFLTQLALSNTVNLYDCTKTGKESRIIFQGIPFIEFVLNKVWYDEYYVQSCYVRGKNVFNYFSEVYEKLDKGILRDFAYMKKFIAYEGITLNGICKKAKFNNEDYLSQAGKLLLWSFRC